MATTDGPYADPGYQKDGQKRYPIDTEAHARAAWSYINQDKNAALYSPDHLALVKGRIKAALRKFGVTIAEDTPAASATRNDNLPAPTFFMRSYPLEDIHIQRGGDGRTVEAYAAVFNTEAEIMDGQGHYKEVIDPGAFNRHLDKIRPQGSRTAWRASVFYNHGLDLYGKSSDRFSVPIGTPLDIRAEARGLITVTRYSASPLAEEILEAIGNGAMAGQSFTGGIRRSDPNKGKFRPTATGQLTTVRRLELGLTEYGPTPMPAYVDAGFVSVRNLTAAPEWDSEQGDIAAPADDATDDSPEGRSARRAEIIRKNRAIGVNP